MDISVAELLSPTPLRVAPAVAGGAEASFPVELVNMYLNKGTAFSQSEREQFKILGLVPPVQESLEVCVYHRSSIPYTVVGCVAW